MKIALLIPDTSRGREDPSKSKVVNSRALHNAIKKGEVDLVVLPEGYGGVCEEGGFEEAGDRWAQKFGCPVLCGMQWGLQYDRCV